MSRNRVARDSESGRVCYNEVEEEDADVADLLNGDARVRSRRQSGGRDRNKSARNMPYKDEDEEDDEIRGKNRISGGRDRARSEKQAPKRAVNKRKRREEEEEEEESDQNQQQRVLCDRRGKGDKNAKKQRTARAGGLGRDADSEQSDDNGSDHLKEGEKEWSEELACGLIDGGRRYRAREDETCKMIAKNLDIDVGELVVTNKDRCALC
jgi:hypothetical protein